MPVEKVVKLHINILNDKKAADGGMPVITKAYAEGLVEVANRIYAPVGIRFELSTQIQIKDPPGIVDLSDGLDEFTNFDAAGRINMTAEEKDLLDADYRTEAKDDIEIYFVNFLAPAPGNHAEAFRASNVPDAKYVDSIVLTIDAPYTTLAHEIGHVLMDDGHHPPGGTGVNKVNLMAFPYQVDGTVTDSRRITVAQANNMLDKRRNLLSNP